MKPKHIYIQPETDAALSKLGGANRAENLRRAVALAECADELAKELDILLKLHDNEVFTKDAWEYAMDKAREAITNYRSAKQ